MDLGTLAAQLSRQHGMAPEIFLMSEIASVYHSNGDIPFQFLRESRPRYLEPESNAAVKLNQSLGSFVLFANAVNPLLPKNYQLEFIYPYEDTRDASSSFDGDDHVMTMALTYNDGRAFRQSPRKKAAQLEVYRAKDGRLIVGFMEDFGDFSCVESNPQLHTVLAAIASARDRIHEVLH